MRHSRRGPLSIFCFFQRRRLRSRMFGWLFFSWRRCENSGRTKYFHAESLKKKKKGFPTTTTTTTKGVSNGPAWGWDEEGGKTTTTPSSIWNVCGRYVFLLNVFIKRKKGTTWKSPIKFHKKKRENIFDSFNFIDPFSKTTFQPINEKYDGDQPLSISLQRKIPK